MAKTVCRRSNDLENLWELLVRETGGVNARMKWSKLHACNRYEITIAEFCQPLNLVSWHQVTRIQKVLLSSSIACEQPGSLSIVSTLHSLTVVEYFEVFVCIYQTFS